MASLSPRRVTDRGAARAEALAAVPLLGGGGDGGGGSTLAPYVPTTALRTPPLPPRSSCGATQMHTRSSVRLANAALRVSSYALAILPLVTFSVVLPRHPPLLVIVLSPDAPGGRRRARACAAAS